MRRSIRELKARVRRGRGKHEKAVQRLAVLRGAQNVLTDDNYLSDLSLHLSGNLQARIPGNRRRQVGEWVNEAYALWLPVQEELDSGESTEEMSSGENTEEMDSGESTRAATSSGRAQINSSPRSVAHTHARRERIGGFIEVIVKMIIGYATNVRRLHRNARRLRFTQVVK